MRVLILVLCTFVAAYACNGRARATAASSGTYTAVMATHSLASDNSLSDPDWNRGRIADGANAFEDITTRSAAPFATETYVLFDAQNLYVGFNVQQAKAKITATQTTHNVGFGIDDFVGIGIDTSGNGSTVYYFETTPRGTRYQQASESTRFYPVWGAAARVDGAAWTAVITIPLSALRAGSGAAQTWRFNFVRGVAATGEHYTWAFDGTMQDAPVPQWPTFGDAQFWPKLSGIRTNGTGLSLRDRARADIYGLGSGGRDRKLFAQANGSFRPEPARFSGMDLSYALTDRIHFVGTLNPDFSNVDVDQQTIAPQEFKRALKEYRPFFAQGAGFLSPISPSAGAGQPNNQIFYSPSIGPFDRGAKLEGSFGYQSFGVLSFRGYDQTTANEFDDVAYGYAHALPDQTFSYWSDGVFAHHSAAGNDIAAEVGTDFHNLRSGVIGGVNEAFESGSHVPNPGHARSLSVWSEFRKANYDAFIDYQDVTPNYNPIDGFTSISDTHGFVYGLNVTGSSHSIKNYQLQLSGDRFLDNSGAVHQSDAIVRVKANLNNQLSFSVGSRDGRLRSYTIDAPGPFGCSDPSLRRTTYTGFPNYYCPQTGQFALRTFNLGYRDGTPSPTDFTFAEGPFGGIFLHQYSISASRQLGRRFSFAAQYAGTYGRMISDGTLNSQWLRLVSIGEALGSDSNMSLELRSVNGLIKGLTTVPGVNLAANYHRKFAGGNELYLSFGTPSASRTLNRFIVKYVLHIGTQN